MPQIPKRVGFPNVALRNHALAILLRSQMVEHAPSQEEISGNVGGRLLVHATKPQVIFVGVLTKMVIIVARQYQVVLKPIT